MQIKIPFKGLKTSEFVNPAKANSLFLEIDSNAISTQEYLNLRKIVHRVIEECLIRKFVTREELARCHI